DDRLRRRLLQKSACGRINRTAHEVLIGRVTDVEFYCVIEGDEFDQVSLAFVVFLWRRILGDGAGNKDKRKADDRKSSSVFSHFSGISISVLFENNDRKRYFRIVCKTSL